MGSEYWKDVPRVCPLCGAKEAERVVEWSFDLSIDGIPRLLIGRCRTCGMVFAVNSDEVDMSGRNYIEWRPESEEDRATPAKFAYNRRVYRHLSKYLKPRSRILDFGAGYCIFLRIARDAGHEVVALNPCRYVADWCRRNLGIEVAVLFGKDYSPDRPFDFVVCDQVIEHLECPLENLEFIRSFLVPGGLAYINVPNWRNYRRFRGGIDRFKDPGHFNYFTIGTLTDMCRRAGFEIVETVPNVTEGLVARPLKGVMNKIGIGDCSVLLRAP
jgi:SAM-dependent methyltransferase